MLFPTSPCTTRDEFVSRSMTTLAKRCSNSLLSCRYAPAIVAPRIHRLALQTENPVRWTSKQSIYFNLPRQALNADEIDASKKKSGANKAVGSKWIYRDKEYEIPCYVRLLANRTGVVHFENDDLKTDRIVVRNGDLSN